MADRFFATVVEGLGQAKLCETDPEDPKAPWRRVVIEKPFGHDLASAKDLNARVLKVLREDQVYRIDHFLGKETVQNIMTFRFANGLFEPLWNRDHIDHVQITVAETVGVEGRGSFYEQTGALRDMVPNHVFQLVAMTAMEPPVSFNADDVRSKKVDVFKSIKTVQPARKPSADNTMQVRYWAGRSRPIVTKPHVDAQQQDRDLCRADAEHRQLALGRRAVLSSHRQVHDDPDDRDRDPVQTGPDGAVCRNRYVPHPGQLDGDADPARRGHLPTLGDQATGT